MHMWNQLYVTHMWKYNPGGMFGGLIKSHHSMVMVSRQGFGGNIIPVFHIDLVHTKNTNRAWVRVFKASQHPINGYSVSSSYSPNPIVKSGNEILAAYDTFSALDNVKYNWQKIDDIWSGEGYYWDSTEKEYIILP